MLTGLKTLKTIDLESERYAVRERSAPLCWRRALMIKSKDVNRNGVGAVDCIDWLPLVDTFRTFYFDELIDFKDKLEIIKNEFIFA